MKLQLASALALAPLFLAGCATTADTQSADAAETPFDVPPADAGSAPAEPAEDDRERSARGNLVGKVGDIATLTPATDPDLDLVTFSVTDIATNLACTVPYADPPQNGHYVGVTMDVATAPDPEFTEHMYGDLYLGSHSFKYVTAEGTTANDVVGNAFMCLDETQLLPSEIGPGEQVTGTVVLDLPTVDGTLILEEMSTGQAWEWRMSSS